MITLAICLPFSGRYVHPIWSIGLANLQYPTNCTYAFFTLIGVKRDQARAILIKEAIKMGAKYVLFLDDDTMPPPDTIKKLIYALDTSDDSVAGAGGIYTNKVVPTEPLVYLNENSGPHWKWRIDDVFKCWGLGTGCLMLKTSVFSKITEPWFRDITSIEEAKDDPAIQLPTGAVAFYMTDDMYFCKKLEMNGFSLLAHGGILPVHFDQNNQSYTLPLNSYPLELSTSAPWYTPFGIQPTGNLI